MVSKNVRVMVPLVAVAPPAREWPHPPPCPRRMKLLPHKIRHELAALVAGQLMTAGQARCSRASCAVCGRVLWSSRCSTAFHNAASRSRVHSRRVLRREDAGEHQAVLTAVVLHFCRCAHFRGCSRGRCTRPSQSRSGPGHATPACDRDRWNISHTETGPSNSLTGPSPVPSCLPDGRPKAAPYSAACPGTGPHTMPL